MPSIAEPADSVDDFRIRSVWDPPSQCTFVVSTPAESPELWELFLAGALAGYRRHGVEKALRYEEICDGASTTLFFAAVEADGAVVGGVRAQGPFASIEDSHAIAEWAGHPGESTVRRMIHDRIPLGIVEMKSAWVANTATRRKALTLSLARFGSYTLELAGVHFLMATAAEHVLKLWKTSGGQVAEWIPPAPYPDDRYRTRLMWWDRRRERSDAEVVQLHKLLSMPHSRARIQLVGHQPRVFSRSHS